MTTPLPDLLWALRKLHVPDILVAIVSFMYRYLFVMLDEAARLMRARASRSAARTGHRAGQTVLWRGRVVGYMVGSLMLRSFERSERIYQAMAARGYAGELRHVGTHHFSPRDWWVMACAILFVAMLVVAGQF
jgi:cobalt/nickel transport system permease protein